MSSSTPSTRSDVPDRLLSESPSIHPSFHDLYPERRDPSGKKEYSVYQQFTGRNLESEMRSYCHDKVLSAFQTMPMVKTMSGALEAMGCPIDLNRHIICQICKDVYDPVVKKGGYDSENNQV